MYSCYSILECYNLFSGVKLSTRSFCFISVIPNSKLKDLITKGPDYREPCRVDRDKNLSPLCKAVDQYALR